MSQKFVVNGGLSIPSGKTIEINGVELTSTISELNYMDITTLGTAEASKALTVSAGNKITLGASIEIEGSNFDINGGEIDGTNVTVGSGKTLDVSGGTLTTSAAQKKAIIEGLNADMDPDFGDNVITAESFVSDVATGTAPFTVASTTKVANLNADLLDGMTTIDEDNMASDSATALPTQQSVKAYVDSQVGNANQLNFVADTNPEDKDTEIALENESLSILGTDNEIETTVSADNTIKIGLPDNVTIGGNLTMTGDVAGSSDDMLTQSGTNLTDYSWSAGTGDLAVQAGGEVVLQSGYRLEGDFTHTMDDSTNANAVFSFDASSYDSAKFHVRHSDGTDTTTREVLVVTNAAGTSAKLVEYGVVSSGTSDLDGSWGVSVTGTTVSLTCTQDTASTNNITGHYQLIK
jgi:hypothetical protein